MKRLKTSRRPVVLAAIVLAAVASCCKQPPDADPNAPSAKTPAPPDLSQCTRIEVRIEPSALEALRIPPPDEPNVLSAEEIRHIESLKTIVIDDPQHIQALAADIALASYDGPSRGGIAIIPVYHISGWREQERLVSFRIKGPVILTEDDQVFRHNRSRRPAVSLTPPLDPFRWRLKCALNLQAFGRALREHAEASHSYPPAPLWCDAFATKGWRAGDFICPGADEGECHYAMNPNCEPGSPRDTVLLFETKGGWNQHGGPEWFTVDNHDPTGGCVLFNDGTVRFIRTHQQLRALRWK